MKRLVWVASTLALISVVVYGQHSYPPGSGGGGGGANTALSNLASVAINTSLIPGGATIAAGGSSNPFQYLYFYGTGTYGTNNFQLTGSATAARTITFPDSSGTVTELGNTTTGSGSTLVLSAAPTISGAATFTGNVKFAATTGTMTSDTDGATITFDLSASNLHTVTLAGNRTLALSNDAAGKVFTIVLVQDGTGSRTVTWFSTIKWAGGSAPTLTTTANKADAFSFVEYSSGNYYGTIAGQAF